MKNQIDENGHRHGLWEQHYYSGDLWRRGPYRHGQPHGPWEWYYSSGELCYKGAYKKSNPVGLWYSSSKQKQL